MWPLGVPGKCVSRYPELTLRNGDELGMGELGGGHILGGKQAIPTGSA